MSAPTVVPSDILQGTPSDSIKINRVPVRVQSDTASYSYNSNVQFTLPNDFCDLRNSYLTFVAKTTAVGGTYVRFSYPIQSMFTRARVFLGSDLVEDVQDFNVLSGMFTLASDYTSVTNVTLPGVYTPDATRAGQAIVDRMYTVHMRLESLQRVYPLHKLKLPLRIQLTIGNGTNFLEYDGALPTTFIVNNAYFNYHSLQVPAEVDAMLDAQIAAGTAKIRIHTYENYQTVAPSASNTTIMLPFKHKTVNAIFCLYRPSASINNPAVTGKFTDIFAGSEVLIQAFCKVGNQIYPSDKYDMQGITTGLGYLQLQIPFNNLMYQDFHAHDRQMNTFMAQTAANRICVPFDLRRDNSPNASLWDNGVNTSGSATSSQLGLTFLAGPGDLSVDVFCRYEEVLTILPGGNIMIEQ